MTKVALFENKELIDKKEFLNDKDRELLNFIKNNDFKQSIISSVINTPDRIINVVKQKASKTIILDSNTKIPINLNYNTPKTLGKDRIALAVGGYCKFPQQNVLIIDIGSCITYDFIDKNGNYQGGAISPGPKLRYKSLSDYTDRLPLLEYQENKVLITGKSTSASIHSGIKNGILFELDGFINDFKNSYKDMKTVICGGYSKYLHSLLKNPTFAELNLLLYGLNEILFFNE